MGVRKQFYEVLRREFANGRDKSFLYGYLKQERQTHPREDDYARLERCYAQLKQGTAAQREYLALCLQVLIQNGRLRPARAGDLLLAYGRALGGEDFFRGLRRDREKYAALQKVLEEGEPALSMPPQTVKAIHEDLLDAILRRDAQTYLYDAGRKKDRDMAMLDAYCEKKGLVLAPGGKNHGSAPLTRQELEQWEALFETLRRERRREVLIPIRIDPRTGAGLFIVGSAYYPQKLRGKQMAACYYACVCLDNLSTEDGDLTLNFRSSEKDLKWSMGLPSLEEAQDWYYNDVLMGSDSATGLYQQCNGAAPGGCPEELAELYFESAGDGVNRDSVNRESLSEEGKKSFQEDTENGKPPGTA